MHAWGAARSGGDICAVPQASRQSKTNGIHLANTNLPSLVSQHSTCLYTMHCMLSKACTTTITSSNTKLTPGRQCLLLHL
jgi:hypothetical protein